MLALHFGSLEALRNAPSEDFENISEIGLVIAKSLYEFFRDPQQTELIDRALSLGLAPVQVEAPGGADALLAGKVVVITGTLSLSRKQWKERLEQAGASVTGSVSAKTDYLLAGESPGSKLAAAEKNEVEVLDEQKMNQLLEKA